jgi:ABC-type dipeptide/oligopeptide/nickel transport system permease component
MLRYVVRRLLLAVITTFGVATIVFVAMSDGTGGFAQALVGANASARPR